MREFGEQKFTRHSLRVMSRAVTPNDASMNLAAAIIEYAVNDWRGLLKKQKFDVRYGAVVSFDELRGFFNSAWGEFLLQYFHLTPERILAQLEGELQEALQDAGTKPKRRYAKRVT